MRQHCLKLVLLVLCLALPLTAVQAQDDKAYLGYRQRVMKSQSGSLGAIGQVVKHKLPFTSHIATHARNINRISKLMPKAFEKKITAGKTDAKPEVWQDWDKFAAAADKLGQESAKLIEVAAGGDMSAIAAQVKMVGKSCGGCHKPFRQPKDKSYKRK